MGHTLLCVLRFFVLNILLYCGHAQNCLLTIEPNWSSLFSGESVTFTCDMREGEDTDWYYRISKDGREFSSYNTNKNYTLQPLATGHSGEYKCFGHHKHSRYVRECNKVSLSVSDKNVILENPASTLYEGESVTLRCRHRTQREERAAAFYKDGSLIEMDTSHQSRITSKNTVEMTLQPLSDGSSYMCKFEDEESESIQLKVETQRPKAKLSKDKTNIPVGGSVTLTCSVSPPSSGWRYFWYRGKKTSELLTTEGVVVLSNEDISVSQEGLYWCRGGRGNPVYYTDYSDAIVKIRAVVTLQPNWPELYYGETITLTCEVKDGGDTEWEYEWTTTSSHKPEKQKEYKIKYASTSQHGSYWCRGRMKRGKSLTEWSEVSKLTLSHKPQPVLTVSPLWLSPGASVTLNCSVKDPSAGWSFYWYKIIPKLSGSSYNFELLPGSSNGTDQDSYMVHGQTHTAGYVCRAGRGDPVSYTRFSEPAFVWSGDLHSAASLTVSPDRVQHFTEQPVSLSCEGNSAEWRVSRFSKFGRLSRCSSWGTMNGSTCNIHVSQLIDGVYWCESETAQFSNAVNITGENSDMILVSPVRPVAEGDPVTLGCKLRTQKVLSEVDFYKNGELIQNDTRMELTIPAVSQSDEGFYKCIGKESARGSHSWTSPESWMSVKLSGTESSPLPLLLIVGLVCGVLLIILLLLLLYYCRKSKDSCFISRSQSTNQGSATDHMINQDETQRKESPSPLHDDACLYESIKDPEKHDNDEPSDVTYSLIELKNMAKKGKQNEPESSVYSAVNTESAADDNLMYAQVCSHKNAKEDKGKSSPAAVDETIYSEVKPGKAADQ